jgi:hypothetical protein
MMTDLKRWLRASHIGLRGDATAGSLLLDQTPKAILAHLGELVLYAVYLKVMHRCAHVWRGGAALREVVEIF